VKGLAESGQLAATVRIPDAAGPLRVEADLRTRRLSTSVTVEAPREGKPLTRVKWRCANSRTRPPTFASM
jgi:hypothetical protein